MKRERIEMMLQNKIGAGVTSGGSIAAGFMTFLEILPRCIGIMASIMGLLLTSVLLYKHILSLRLSKEEHRLKMEKLELEVRKLKEE